MRRKRMRFGASILQAVSSAPAKAEHPGYSHKFRVFLISSRWVRATRIVVIRMKYGDSTLVPRSIVTTFAGTVSSSSPDSFATYMWAAEKYGGQNAAQTSFASILVLVFSTKSLIHLDLFPRLRWAR